MGPNFSFCQIMAGLACLPANSLLVSQTSSDGRAPMLYPELCFNVRILCSFFDQSSEWLATESQRNALATFPQCIRECASQCPVGLGVSSSSVCDPWVNAAGMSCPFTFCSVPVLRLRRQRQPRKSLASVRRSSQKDHFAHLRATSSFSSFKPATSVQMHLLQCSHPH